MSDLLPDGVREHMVDTARLRMRVVESGDPDGTPVVFVHGNLGTCRFYDDQLAAVPDGFRFIAADMRGFGDTEPLAIDGTRGLRDWSDDTVSLLDALGLDGGVHLAGWSTGGGAIMQLLIDAPARVASLTLIGPVSPYGFGGVRRDGSPCQPDHAGSGGLGAAPDFVAQLRAGNLGLDDPFAIRNVMRTSYWSPAFTMEESREIMLAREVLKGVIGPGGYPGDGVSSDYWPGFAPGSTGVLNALSPKYLDTSGIVDAEPKPPIVWHRGDGDVVVSDASAWDPATLGAAGLIPGWPGEEAYPQQPMVSQIRDVLEAYEAAGGSYREIVYQQAGHGPHIDHAEEFNANLRSTIGA